MKVRLNRKDGKIYVDDNGYLTEYGTHIDLIVLWHSAKFVDELFGFPRQEWIQVTGLNGKGNVVYFVMNSGSTNALDIWIQYLSFLSISQFSVSKVVTRFGFEYLEDLDSYDYAYQAFVADVESRLMLWRANNPIVPMVDNSLPASALSKLKKMYRNEVLARLETSNERGLIL